ncbi:valine--tRNA ligase [Coprococcus eutactus]|uniref:valine--tRNA ligase n=1 Tax=Coprococcus eutactus TaxID=33043 RepID=UPI0011C77A2C|nr:valine--tRNA ligase [Coprococcus eutactus]MBT9754612.1 valine--tRNA ligase [Coprococcus eutactus]MCB6629464.1 valine--tRNA ligase [Coprococcus eutactus]MCG4790562.1 valine--tRNA ligase [Coprococcus eutactus]MCQ5119270.1 valine--tRNA ligase [Coprococcus eutactus]MCQ5133116.1 valine--tRNA ligase [Coprococcus eutactus]
MKELEKTYDPSQIEDRLYRKWEEKKYFHAEVDRSKKPFTIVMPPPNVTGQLHMGHALDNTMQDILIRFKRMQGYSALWQPGTDHAAIATEVKVTEKLKEQGIDKKEIGREEFLKHAWAWKEEYGNRIVSQLKKMGSSADWDRERFTMDEGCSRAVKEVFVRLYDKGYIYKGSRIINWCPVCKTSISDAEVIHEEQDGYFWHINYPVVGEPGRFVEIATTRPETLLGDTAVAVNPDDERYTDIVGKMLELPLTDRQIPVIADPYVDKEFGTGCVKITPAHDPNDFEVGKRHNLEEINILNDDATINELGGKYAGMDRYEARKQMVADLDALGLLVKVVPHSHNVGTHDRCKTTVEPMIKPQWFVRMKEMGQAALDIIKTDELSFVPEQFDKTYIHWLENIRDWCISRQLWWGHRIPAWYCDECGETIVSRETPTVCPKCGCTHLTQDEDTLDTWFSSALWPFSTLGWPDKTPEYEYFYPTSVLVTGYDIIFFWVIRMVFSALEQTGKSPFKHVLIHGLVRDDQGRKMSKSLGNGIDPLEVIDKYGADALRLTLITGNAPGNDMRFYWERVENSRNFANKIWNATRFIMMNMEKADFSAVKLSDLTISDRWILSKVNTLAKEMTDNMEKFELGIAVSKVYDFIWEEFCDWYIEMVKPRLYNDEDETKAAALWTLKTVLIQALKLLHPYMPFITEEIFCNIQDEEESIMISKWPEYTDEWNFETDEAAVDTIKAAVRAIRNLRTGMNVPPSRKAKVYVVSAKEDVRYIFESSKSFFATLGYASEVHVQEDKTGIDENAVSTLIHDAAVYIPLEELVDIDKEIERLEKEAAKLAGEIKRASGMLANPKFVDKAPAAKVEEEKAKLAKYTEMSEQVAERLAQLKK